MRVDLNFNDISGKKYFKELDQNFKYEEISDLIKISEIFENGEEGDSSPFSKKIFQKYIKNTNNEEKKKILESVELIDKNLLIEKIKAALELLEEILITQKLHENEEIFNGKKTTLMKIKFIEENKFRLYISKENPQTENIEIILKNGFESFGFYLLFI